jgi:hypothetical protein
MAGIKLKELRLLVYYLWMGMKKAYSTKIGCLMVFLMMYVMVCEMMYVMVYVMGRLLGVESQWNITNK